MKKSIIKQAKNKEEAIRLALNEIGKDRSEVEIEVIEEGSAGFLGLGSKDAVIKVIYDESVEESLFDFEEEIKAYIKQGLRTKEITKIIKDKSSFNKNEIYEYVLTLSE